MTLPYPIIIVLSLLVLIAVYRRAPEHLRIPLLFYVVSYGVTTVVGATVIGASAGESLLWTLTNVGLNTGALSGGVSTTYWLILYSPLVVIPLAALLFDRLPTIDYQLKRFSAALELPALDLISYYVVFIVFSAYCLVSLAEGGYLTNVLTSSQLQGDFRSIIQLRVAMAESLSPNFYGVMYGTLPLLSNIALYMALTSKSKAWFLALGLAVCMTVFLNLSIMLKGVLLIYVLTLAIGVALHSGTRVYVLALGCLLAFLGLTIMQFFMQDTIDFAQNFNQLFFRMANSFPFYLDLYPHVYPYMGTNHGLSLIGIEINYNDVTKVIDVMYPDITWVQPQTAAPAHLRGYAQGGPVASLVIETVIALLVAMLARIAKVMDGPLMFGFYLQGLVMIYYTTQASLGAALFQSYGIKWAIIGVLALWGWYHLSHRAIHGCSGRDHHT